MVITDEQLAAWARLCEGATALNERISDIAQSCLRDGGGHRFYVRVDRIYQRILNTLGTSTLIVTQLPALLTEVRAQREEVERLRWERDVLAGTDATHEVFYDMGAWYWRSKGERCSSDPCDTVYEAIADLRRHLESEGQA